MVTGLCEYCDREILESEEFIHVPIGEKTPRLFCSKNCAEEFDSPIMELCEENTDDA